MKTKLLFIVILINLWSLYPALCQNTHQTLVENHLAGMPDQTIVQMAVLDHGTWDKFAFEVQHGTIKSIPCKDQLFEIGSITKVFTASLVMKLSEKGKISPEDPIQKFLPFPMKKDSFQGHTIQVKHLLTHTSGLSNGPSSFTLPYLKARIFAPKNPNKYFKTRHMYKYLKDFELDYSPGNSWAYNNLGYGLLGTFCETSTGRSWENLIQENIFEPLGMKESWFEINHQNSSKLIQGTTEKGKPSKPWDMDFINP
ncbi:MAG: beta-lactamase family protein, partial [Saprospiraceae bacterium]|nr:beta-lactamase family protein [Saprospiraceae bacterium]